MLTGWRIFGGVRIVGVTYAVAGGCLGLPGMNVLYCTVDLDL